MTNACCTENLRLDVLRQLFSSATHDASAAMCRWTDGLITLTLDDVREIPLEDISAELGVGDELLTVLTMLVISLEGELGGVMVLAFDETNGRKLAASLLGSQPGDSPQWSELEKSALAETGNILGCAYMNALSRLTDTSLMPSPPDFIQDYGASVLQQALMAQAVSCDKLLICRTGFHYEGEKLDWRVFFVPTEAMQTKMENTVHCLN
jgi:chemotaxis protein CheC